MFYQNHQKLTSPNLFQKQLVHFYLEKRNCIFSVPITIFLIHELDPMPFSITKKLPNYCSWLYVDHRRISVLRHTESDQYYKNHDLWGQDFYTYLPIKTPQLYDTRAISNKHVICNQLQIF